MDAISPTFLRHRVFAALLIVALTAAPGAAFAAKTRLGDSGGGGTPTPIEGNDLMVSFNPTATVRVGPYQRIGSVLTDLAAAINAVADWKYVATVPEETTLEILRTDGTEIDDLHFAESDAGIQSVTLTVARPDLVAWIGAVRQTPSAGVLIVTLNDRRALVWTTSHSTPAAVNLALLQAIRSVDFDADYLDPYIIVRRDLGAGSGIATLGLQSTDAAITWSDLALLPAPSAAP